MGGKSPSAAERMRAARRSTAKQPPVASVEWIVPQKYSRRDSSLIDVHVDEKGNTIDIRLPLP